MQQAPEISPQWLAMRMAWNGVLCVASDVHGVSHAARGGAVQLANPALKERHWEKIFFIVGQEYEAGAPVHVQQLLDSGVLANLEEVQTVATTASKEYSMLKMLEKMESVWPRPLTSHALRHEPAPAYCLMYWCIIAGLS